jgi:hypothetical protein
MWRPSFWLRALTGLARIAIAKIGLCSGRSRAGFILCDKAPPSAAVMLHLRARYVSKAAILGLPGQIVPVENRSPI